MCHLVDGKIHILFQGYQSQKCLRHRVSTAPYLTMARKNKKFDKLSFKEDKREVIIIKKGYVDWLGIKIAIFLLAVTVSNVGFSFFRVHLVYHVLFIALSAVIAIPLVLSTKSRSKKLRKED